MFYLIESNLWREHSFNKLLNSIKRMDTEYEIINVKPFTRQLEIETKRLDVFPFGSTKLADIGKKNELGTRVIA